MDPLQPYAGGRSSAARACRDSAFAESALDCAAMTDDPAERPTVALLPGHQKRALHGHPWIFSNEVQMDAAAKALPPGSLVTLRTGDGKTLGVATFNPHTLVAARLLDRDASRHIDRDFLVKRLKRALAIR